MLKNRTRSADLLRRSSAAKLSATCSCREVMLWRKESSVKLVVSEPPPPAHPSQPPALPSTPRTPPGGRRWSAWAGPSASGGEPAPGLAACALHRAPLADRPDFFGAGGCLLIWHGVGGFATNSSASSSSSSSGRRRRAITFFGFIPPREEWELGSSPPPHVRRIKRRACAKNAFGHF